MPRKFRYIILPFLLFFAVFPAMSAAADGNSSYIINLEGKRQEIPLAYTVDAVYSYFDLPVDRLSAATDLFVDDKDQLYILDSGNGRILKLDAGGGLIREYSHQGEYSFHKANGIYVDRDENIYVADTENGRVLVMGSDGQVVRVITQPQSPLYDTAYPFKPVKVGVDSLGQVYVLNDLDYHGFIVLDESGDFKYLASSRLSANPWERIISMFASESQREKLGKRVPPIHSNFTFGPDGGIYTTTANTDTEQFKLFSAVGNNYFPKKNGFGDTRPDYIMTKFGKKTDSQLFSDVCVDSSGIITLLESNSGRIFQYDQDGVMLCAFGGTGNWAGRFMNAVAIDIDSAGNLYVLDSTLGTVQKLKPSNFILTVHNALSLYASGKYIEAQESWREILVSDPAYPVAHIGLGKAALKQGDLRLSIEHYRRAGDKFGYSDAFSAYFKGVVQRYFILIVVGIMALVIGLYLVANRLYRRAKKLASGR